MNLIIICVFTCEPRPCCHFSFQYMLLLLKYFNMFAANKFYVVDVFASFYNCLHRSNFIFTETAFVE